MLDHQSGLFEREQIAFIYRHRWQVEVSSSALECILGVDIGWRNPRRASRFGLTVP